MRMVRNGWISAAGVLAAFALAMPASADTHNNVQNSVRDGVEAWSQGDYDAAVSQWQAPADAGDADAMFNMAQAYRLGRGVPRDDAAAEALYARAAEAGHMRAADTYGLMLFQSGRREEAIPYITPAASRGDPRAQYLLGVAHFNGMLVARDWERAYALLTLANAAGLPQAANTIIRMDEHIPIAERQRGVALARVMGEEAERTRAVNLASLDLAVNEDNGPAPARPVRMAGNTPAAPPSGVEAARGAIAQARTADGTSSPANAGASYVSTMRPATQPVAPPPVRVAVTPATAPVTVPAAPATMNGPWRVQLGAFSQSGNAERLWSRLSNRTELAGSTQILIPTGRVTRLLAGGFPTSDAARSACDALKASGQDCLVTR